MAIAKIEKRKKRKENELHVVEDADPLLTTSLLLQDYIGRVQDEQGSSPAYDSCSVLWVYVYMCLLCWQLCFKICNELLIVYLMDLSGDAPDSQIKCSSVASPDRIAQPTRECKKGKGNPTGNHRNLGSEFFCLFVFIRCSCWYAMELGSVRFVFTDFLLTDQSLTAFFVCVWDYYLI